MKILPVKNSVFKGKAVYYNAYSMGVNGIKQMSEYHPDSAIEKVIDNRHSVPKDMVYFASPMEFVSNDLKSKFDYIVYDNEPSYPALEEIKKNYLEKNRTNYRKIFENIRDYYYRREMGGHASSNEAKYQQWQAAECIRLYDKAGDLRYKKETAEDEIKNMKSEKIHIMSGIASTKKELDSQKNIKRALELQIKNLRILLSPNAENEYNKVRAISNENALYSVIEARVVDTVHKRQMKESLEKTAYYNEGREAYPYDGLKYGKYADTVRIYSSVKQLMEMGYCLAIHKGISQKNNISITDTIARFEDILKESNQFIGELNGYIEELESKVTSLDSEIKNKTSFIEGCKEKLEPLFEEFQKYYLKQGIKVIKK